MLSPTMSTPSKKHGNYTMPSEGDVIINGNWKLQAVNNGVCKTANIGGTQKATEDTNRKCCKYGPASWCKKYFWEGQELKKPIPKDYSDLPRLDRILIKHRRLIGFCLPALFFHFFWWALVIHHDLWRLFVDKYVMPITMIFGSIIAGMTSEGGGAVAFPVMTLALKIKPCIARDFAMMIQSCGMSAASFTIFFMRVRVEWHSLIFCSLGGVGGMIFGLHVVDPAMSASSKKLGFVSIWFAFASVLIVLNRTAKRRTFSAIPNFSGWKAIILIVFGFLGGIFTSFSGSGIDICSFMILTLLFRISEKVATPTSVILMALNSIVGFYWRGVMFQTISQDAWEYLVVCIPIVVIGAPIGSLLGSHFHRLVLASLVIILDTIALISAFVIVKPLTPIIIGACAAIIVACFLLFLGFTYAGQKLLDGYESREKDLSYLESKTIEKEVENHIGNGKIGNGSTNIGFAINEQYASELTEVTRM